VTLRLRILLVLYGVLNATAYTFLLPLWEGFDEAYHYGYVQSLSTDWSFPVLDQTTLSQEIWHAFELAPVSHYLQPFTRAPVNYRDYFALSQEERTRRRQQLDSLPAYEKYRPQLDKGNYEASQSPAPYVLMATVDRLLSGFPLTTRVLWLRLLCSVAAVLLLWHATLLLARKLSLPDGCIGALMFCVFSSQMLYATICHVCNDWLAVPLFCYLTWAAIRAHQSGSVRDYLLLGLVLSAGLLTKAYFLALVPLAATVVGWGLWRRRARLVAATAFTASVALLAGPWYVRNLVLYRSFGGTLRQDAGLGPKQLLEAMFSFPWPKSILSMAHSSLWTGNNSFTAFSSTTLNLVLLLLALGLGLYIFRRPRQAPERIVIAAVVLFCLGLAYVSVAFFAGTRGAVFAAMPWYMQVLLAPMLLLAFLGMSRARRWGGTVARLTVLLWGYVLATTYVAKLIPMYGGFSGSRAHLPDLWAWYLNDGARRDAIFGTLCLVSPSVLWGVVCAVILLDAVLCVRLASAGYTNRPR
jgi:4-amino-4-deoxy-L-arabinose transferase-like glycosyltransferase